MCDYSLHGIPNRLAVEGEPLTVHRFPTGSKGLASPADLQIPASGGLASLRSSLWERVKTWFSTPPILPEQKAIPAVCIPPGARLLLQDIPPQWQELFGVNSTEEVTFVQLSADVYCYRDAMRFSNGLTVLLQKFSEGQRVAVRCLELTEEPVERLPQSANNSFALHRT